MRFDRGKVLGAALLFAGMTGCLGGNDGPPLQTLTAADVTGLPAGSAVGAQFSGTYLVAAAALSGCHCRVGTCGLVHVQVGGLNQFVQQDGALTVTDQSGQIMSGGIDADGTYMVGGTAQLSDGVVAALMHGTIQLDAAGTPTSGPGTNELTLTGVVDGNNMDCDIRGDATFRFESR